jgi:D-alanyl-D-alanine carboxypeptidase
MLRMKLLAIAALASAVMAVMAATTVHASGLRVGVAKLTREQAHMLQKSGEWHPGCPVMPGHLRLLTARYYGFDHRTHLGQIVVNEAVTGQLMTVFQKLYAIRFPIREMSFASMYGPHPDKNGDVTASFECRDAVPSPCNGNTKGTNWSMHAYGEAVDLDPRENPYVGCGMTRDKTARSYMKRSNVRPGMVTRAIFHQTFGSVGWGWGGLWTGSTKDYMHFSTNGH